jgi:hypothetical protein
MACRNFSLAISLFLLVALMAFAGCASHEPMVLTRTVEVEVPVAAPVQLPEQLAGEFIAPPRPVFVSPTDPAVTAGLTEQGMHELRALLFALKMRVDLWQAWANSQRGSAN